jgi:hypothetical protein
VNILPNTRSLFLLKKIAGYTERPKKKCIFTSVTDFRKRKTYFSGCYNNFVSSGIADCGLHDRGLIMNLFPCHRVCTCSRAHQSFYVLSTVYFTAYKAAGA